MITLAGWSATGADLVLPLGYAVTIVFFALVFPPRSQVVYLVALLASYGAVQLSTDVDLLSFAMLAVLGVLACFLSREVRRRIALHEHARVDTERRWSVVGAVATTARDAEASDPWPCCRASWMPSRSSVRVRSDPHRGRRGAGPVFLPSDIDGDSAAAVRSLPIRSGRLSWRRDARPSSRPRTTIDSRSGHSPRRSSRRSPPSRSWRDPVRPVSSLQGAPTGT